MKRRILSALLASCVLATCTGFSTSIVALAAEETQKDTENSYFESLNADEVNIQDTGIYTIHLKAKEGWQFDVEDNTDVTGWLANAQGQPVIADKTGVAFAVNGEDFTLDITIDASKITGFTSNGSGDLYVMPNGGIPLVVEGDNHGMYHPTLAKAGRYTIPTIEVIGSIEGGTSGMEPLAFTEDTVTIKLNLEGLDESQIDSSAAEVTMLDGDGYYITDFIFTPNKLAENWENGETTYTLDADDIACSNSGYELSENGGGRGWAQQGGDGNGNYYMNLGVSGITYKGLPLAQASFRMHVYCYGRTFTIDGGSLIANTQPKWSTTAENNLPVLCDTYPDYLNITWPLNFDASALTAEDFTLTMRSAYGDELVLEPNTDFTVNTTVDQSTIAINYMLWANTPVYTTLTVDVSPENLSWNSEKYRVTSISHTYDIASVYAYYVMSGGMTGTQTWSYYGVDGLESWEQAFVIPTYILTYVDEMGVVKYYAEDENGNGKLVDTADEAAVFDAREDCSAMVLDNAGYFTRVYDQKEEKEVDGTVYTFDKSYSNADNLPLNPDQCIGLTAQPGYVFGTNWSMHGRWPWQSFIGLGFEGGRS